MARPRVIDQDDILDAAEAVVRRDGAARLTLDSVAVEAGVSKGSVIYDYGTKHALIKAVIERRVTEEEAKLQGAIARIGPVPNALIKARIIAAEALPDDARAVSIQLCSALAQDGELREALNASLREQVDAIAATSENPRAARLAFLAVEGLRALEYLGLLTWPEPERTDILKDIERLAGGTLEEVHGGHMPTRAEEEPRRADP